MLFRSGSDILLYHSDSDGRRDHRIIVIFRTADHSAVLQESAGDKVYPHFFENKLDKIQENDILITNVTLNYICNVCLYGL